jgi:hypothetical protein
MAAVLVPDEAPSLNSQGMEFWPAGWGRPDSWPPDLDPASPARRQPRADTPSGAPASGAARPLAGCAARGVLWGPYRRVETEADILELLRVPYRTPEQRDCP